MRMNVLLNSCFVFLAGLCALQGFSQRLEQYPLPDPQPVPALEFKQANAIVSGALMFISGAAHGVSETLVWHYPRFQQVHPNANPRYWNPRESWVNKYRNGDPAQGRAYVGSTTWLAWTTDGYHLMNTISRTTAVAGLTIPLYTGSGKKFKHYALEAAGKGLVWTIGFHSTYSMLY